MIKSHTINECHGCFITSMLEMDHWKQPEISPNWRFKKQKLISQEWKHISLIYENQLKTYSELKSGFKPGLKLKILW